MISLAAFVLALPITASVSALTLNGPLMLASTAVTNVTGTNYIHQCDTREYGENLNIASCLEALDQIDDHSTVEQSYGERYKGVFDVKLPIRYISSDGVCAIDLRLRTNKLSARASLQEVSSAARYVIDQCVNARPSAGGIARQIGGDNNLDVIVQKLEPQVECSGTVSLSLLSSCQNLVEIMPASQRLVTWGPPDDPFADFRLPYEIFSLDRQCKLTVSSTDDTDIAARYQFWRSAVSLTGVCVKGGQAGRQDRLGFDGQLSVEIGQA